MYTSHLNLADLVTGNTPEELRDLLEQQGKISPNATEKQFRNLVIDNWKRLRSEKLETRNTAPLIPSKLQPLHATVNNTTYRIYGVVHISSFDPDVVQYNNMVRKTLMNDILERKINPGNLLFEQVLAEFFDCRNGLFADCLELIDHTIAEKTGMALSFAGGYAAGLIIPLIPLIIATGLHKRLGKRDRNDLSRLTYINPQDQYLHHPLPPAFWHEQELKPFFSTRSAYIAEFARLYNPGETKTIVTGSFHAPEVKYFLEQKCVPEKIVQKAEQHVRLAEQGLLDQVKYQSKKIGFAANTLGIIAGLGTWPTTYYFI